MVRERIGLKAEFFIAEGERHLRPLPKVVLKDIWQSVANSDRLIWILSIEVVASNVRVSILAENEAGFLVKRSTWKDFYGIPGATELIDDLFPPLVHLTDFFSEMLQYHCTGIPEIMLYRWPQPEDESSFEALPFLVFALTSYSFRLRQQDFEALCIAWVLMRGRGSGQEVNSDGHR
jgi:hypothetical protein